mgnify:CR=1 FL=1
MNFLLTADESAGLHALRLIKSSGHKIVGLVVPNANKAIRRLAKEWNLKVYKPSNLRSPQFAKWIQFKKVDVLLNIHLLEIIHPENISALKIGGFNLHPGPLPEYAGLHTPSWAIYNGEANHGVTLHWLDPGIDTGPIAYKSIVPIKSKDTGLSLSRRCMLEGMVLVSDLLNDLTNSADRIPRVSQDLSTRNYYGKGQVPQYGTIKWNKSALQIERFVRASNYAPFTSPWGYPAAEINGVKFEIVAVNNTYEEAETAPGSVRENLDGEILVASKDYWVKIERCRIDEKLVSPKKVIQKKLNSKKLL